MLGEQFSQLAGNEGYMQQMRQQALSQLVDEMLLDQYAKDLKLAISDEQIKQAIFSQPAFQTDGKFDNANYLGIINSMGFSADQYAEALRKQLTTQQLISAIAGTDFTLSGETDALAALVSQQRVVRQATLSVDALAAKQQVSDDEIKTTTPSIKQLPDAGAVPCQLSETGRGQHAAVGQRSGYSELVRSA